MRAGDKGIPRMVRTGPLLRDKTVARVQGIGSVIPPEQLAASGTEDGHQCAVMQKLAIEKPQHWEFVHHVPNGGERSAQVGGRMKAMGVRRGVPDIVWPIRRGGYPGLYVELKIPKYRTAADRGRTKFQEVWCQHLVSEGYAVVLAFGWYSAWRALFLYGRGELKMPAGSVDAMELYVEPPPEV